MDQDKRTKSKHKLVFMACIDIIINKKVGLPTFLCSIYISTCVMFETSYSSYIVTVGY